MSEHAMFTTWSGIPGKSNVWCLTCSQKVGESVAWEECANTNTPPALVENSNDSERIKQ